MCNPPPSQLLSPLTIFGDELSWAAYGLIAVSNLIAYFIAEVSELKVKLSGLFLLQAVFDQWRVYKCLLQKTLTTQTLVR